MLFFEPLMKVCDSVFGTLVDEHFVVAKAVDTEVPQTPAETLRTKLMESSSTWPEADDDVIAEPRAVVDFLASVDEPRIDLRVGLPDNVRRITAVSNLRKVVFSQDGERYACVGLICPCRARSSPSSSPSSSPLGRRAGAAGDVSSVFRGLVPDYARSGDDAERQHVAARAAEIVRDLPEYAVSHGCRSWKGYHGLVCHACGDGVLAYPDDGIWSKHDLPSDPRQEAHVAAIHDEIIASAPSLGIC